MVTSRCDAAVPPQRRSAFTLIELLVVITIIAVLAGLVLSAANLVTSSSKRNQTETTFTAIQQGLRLTMAERGSLPSPSEHPMAGSRAPRATFVRSGGGLVPGGEALRGVEADQVIVPVRGRLLLGEDRYADPALPLLYGLERHHIGVLAAPRGDVTRYRWLAVPEGESTVPDRDGDGDYTDADYPDRVHLVAPTSTASDSRGHIEFFLGAHTLDELARLGALHEAASTGDLLGGRLRAGEVQAERWEPGRVLDPSDAWRDYRLPGLAIYDAWGREVLYALRDGQVALLSAGVDGVFALDPGDDGVYDVATDPLTGALGGDDRDGRHDNVGVGQ